MSNNNAQLERIKSLMKYDMVNEEANRSNYTLVESKKAADGVTYGIIKENHKFYIKTAQSGKETIAEAYKYIGGWANHTDYQYSNLRSAEEALRGKISSINEAHSGEFNYVSLEPYKKELVYEGCSEEFKNQLARYRQLFKNTAAIMNESCEIGADNIGCGNNKPAMKNDQNCKGDEACKGKKGDECVCDKKAEEDKSGKKTPKGTNGVDKKVAPFDNEPKVGKNQIKENALAGNDTDINGARDWNDVDGAEEPKNVGWDIEGQQQVNEEEDWASKGLPGEAGIGEADTDHNNMPFDENVNEGCCAEGEDEIELGGDDLTIDGESIDDIEGLEDEPEFEDEDEDEFSEDDFDEEEEPEFDDEESELDDVEGDEEEPEFDDVEGEDEEAPELGGEDIPESDDVDESDADSVRAEIARLQSVLDGLEGDEDAEGEDFGGEDSGEVDGEVEGEEFAGEEDECGGMNPMMEAKQRKMNSIVESVVKKILKEDELHDFGKHPGYRKKPMELPATGEDKNQWGEDWNDESVYSEEPFGQKIGSSFPFEDFVQKVTDDVMYQIKSGDAFKKKA